MKTVPVLARDPLGHGGERLVGLAFVLEALLQHPRLRIADRRIAIEKQRVKAAIAGFLPRLFGFASYGTTSDHYARYARSLLGGVSVVLSVFNGFADFHAYKAARQGARMAYIQREEECLNVVLQVINTHLQLEDAAENLLVAWKAYEAAKGRLDQIQAQWEEGLIHPAERLQALAERDRFQVSLLVAGFTEQVSAAALLNALGTSHSQEEVEKNEHPDGS